MPMKLVHIISFLTIVSCSTHLQNVQIDEGAAFGGPEEPSICVNPTNTDNIVAGSNISNTYYSTDGGLKWTKLNPKSIYGVAGDPCLIADKNGKFYFFHLSNDSTDPKEGWLDRIVCQTSEDGGKTWNNGSYMGLNGTKDQDKEWAAINPVTNEIYVTWTEFDKYASKEEKDSSYILFSQSKDDGKTWSDAIRLNQFAGNCIDDDLTTEGATPAIGPNGEIYVSWSFDDKVYFDKSLDNGKTWLEKDKEVCEQSGGWVFNIPGIYRSNGLPITCTDLSDSTHRGNIYINYAAQNDNDTTNTDIWFVKSTDKGESWGEPIKVNDDTTNSHQFFTWMTVDQTNGNIYIVYYDRSNYNDWRTDVKLAYSKDGGASFKNITISEEPFVPNPNIFFGDYNNISAHNNVIRPIWTRLHKNRLSVWTCLIDGEKLD